MFYDLVWRDQPRGKPMGFSPTLILTREVSKTLEKKAKTCYLIRVREERLEETYG